MRNGQVIILTVLTLGATMLGATTIAGLLMLYQLRQATDFANSGKAIFAADTGIECALFKYFNADFECPTALSNGAEVEISCYKGGVKADSCSDVEVDYVKSVGSSGNASRAFGLQF